MEDFSLIIALAEEKFGHAIHLKAVKKERFVNHGFGTFLCDIKPSEISITQEALDTLLNCSEKGGLQGMEFWEENRIAWGSQSFDFIVPIKHISVHRGAKKWIKEMSVKG